MENDDKYKGSESAKRVDSDSRQDPENDKDNFVRAPIRFKDKSLCKKICISILMVINFF